jgi:hypothetical protein
MSNDILTETQKEAMRAYHRAWRKTHPDSVKRSRQKFAQKQAERMGLNIMESNTIHDVKPQTAD